MCLHPELQALKQEYCQTDPTTGEKEIFSEILFARATSQTEVHTEPSEGILICRLRCR